MLLESLVEQSYKIDLPPSMYDNIRLRWLIDLDPDGQCLQFIPLEGEGKRADRGKMLLAPSLKRTVTIKPKLLCDNGSYILGLAPEGKKQTREIIGIYMANAALIRQSLTKLGYQVYGGVNAPYIWLKTPKKVSSWDFFDMLLTKANVIGTPGAGFGPAGEGYFRLTAFARPADVKEAMQRFTAI